MNGSGSNWSLRSESNLAALQRESRVLGVAAQHSLGT